jgi:hypothetical protein
MFLFTIFLIFAVDRAASSFYLALVVSVGLPLCLSVQIWKPYLRRRAFARMLLRDARAGMVREGWLSSGLPWVVNGEPARWRVGRPKGGTHGVTKEQALELQGLTGSPLASHEDFRAEPASKPVE